MGQLARIADTLDRIADTAEAREARFAASRPYYTASSRRHEDLARRAATALERTATATQERNNLIAADSEERRRMFEKDQAMREHQFEAITDRSATISLDEANRLATSSPEEWGLKSAPVDTQRVVDRVADRKLSVRSAMEQVGYEPAKPRGFWHPKGPECQAEPIHEHSGDAIFWITGPRRGETTGKPQTAFQRFTREPSVGVKHEWVDLKDELTRFPPAEPVVDLHPTVDEKINAAAAACGWPDTRGRSLSEFRRELRLRGLDIVDLAAWAPWPAAFSTDDRETLALAKWLHAAGPEEREGRLAAYTSAKYATRDR